MSFAKFGLRVRSFSVYSYILSNRPVSLMFLMASRTAVCVFGVVICYPALLIVMDIRLFCPVCHIVVLSHKWIIQTSDLSQERLLWLKPI